MALLIDGDTTAFRAVAYRRPSEEMVGFLQRQFDDPSRALQHANSAFINRAREMFETSMGEDAQANLEAVRRRMRRAWDLDGFNPLSTREEFQTAQPTMQRFVMANPFVRRLYQQGRISGYADSYVNHSPKDVGRDHLDYQMVMSGVGVETDDGDWEATTIGYQLLEGDQHLLFEDKVVVLDAWDKITYGMMNDTRDWTCPKNSEWG